MATSLSMMFSETCSCDIVGIFSCTTQVLPHKSYLCAMHLCVEKLLWIPCLAPCNNYVNNYALATGARAP